MATTIRVDERTRDRLFAHKTPGDSYDDVVAWLLDEVDEHRRQPMVRDV
jgi:hypothetical protein